MTPLDLALVSAALLLACTVQSAFGFGLALVAVPVLATRLPFELVTPLLALVSMALGGSIAWRARRAVRHDLLRPLLASAALGVPLGIALVTRVDERSVRVALGIFVALAASRGLIRDLRDATAVATADTEAVSEPSRSPIRRRPTREVPLPAASSDVRASTESVPRRVPRRVLWPTGIAIGALGGAWNLMGPPLVLLLQRARLAPDGFRATLHAFAFVINLLVVVVWLASGAPPGPIAAACALALVPLLVGGWLGARLAARVDTHRYRLAVHGLLIASAATLLVSVIGAGGTVR